MSTPRSIAKALLAASVVWLLPACSNKEPVAAEPAPPLETRVDPLTFTVTSQTDFGTTGTITNLDTTTTPGSIHLPRRSPWWDTSWHYRFALDVNAGALARTDFPVEMMVDFPTLLTGTGGTIDTNSVRVIEVNGSGAFVAEATSRFDLGTASKNGYLAFNMSGNTAAGVTRKYYVYFDIVSLGPKTAPSYYTSTASTSVGNTSLTWSLLGQNQAGTSSPTGFAGGVLTATPAIPYVYTTHNKLFSSLGSYATQASPGGYSAIATNSYASFVAATTLVNDSAFKVHKMSATAGTMRVTRYVLPTTGAGTRMSIVLENIGATSATGGQFFEGGDFDIADATDDRGAWVAADSTVYAYDSNGAIGLRGVVAPSHFQADDRTVVFSGMNANLLGDKTAFGPGDVGFGMQWALPTLAAGDAYLLQEAWAISTAGYAGIQPLLQNLSTPPTRTAGSAEPLFTASSGSYVSAVLDGTAANPSWATLTWTATVPTGSTLTFDFRTGNTATPDGTWSAWSGGYSTSPATLTGAVGARYLQWRANFTSSNGGGTSAVLADVAARVAVTPTRLTFTTTPSTITAGGCTSVLTVQAQDVQGDPGNVVSDITVNFSSSSAGGTFYTNAACTTALSGNSTVITAPATSTATTVYYKDTVAGTPTLTASATGLTPGTTGLTVNFGAVNNFLVSGFPSSATAGVAGAFTVTARDSLGNTVTNYLGTVTLTSNSTGATLPAAYTFVAGDNGTKTFSATMIAVATARTLTATAGSISGSQTGIAVVPGPLSYFVVSGFPASRTAGSASTFTVTAKDAYANTVTGYTGTASFSSSDPQAVLAGPYTFVTGDNGVKAGLAATLKTAGSQTIVATAGAATGSQSTTITFAAMHHFTVAGFSNPATAGDSGTFTVAAKDQYENTRTSYTGTVTFTSNDPAAVLPAATAFVAADNGVRTFSATLKTAGSRTLTATQSSFTGTQTVTVAAAAASTFVVSGFTTPVTAGTAGTFTVTAKDAFSNTATNFTGAVSFSSSDAQAALPSTYTFVAGDNGVKTGLGATLKTSGSQSITATSGAVTGSQSGITVNAAAMDHFDVTGLSDPTTAGTAATLTVTAKDAYNNTRTTFTGAVTFSSTDGAATLPGTATFVSGDNGVKTGLSATLRTAGSRTVTATSSVGGYTGAQTVMVNAAALDNFLVTGFPSPVTAGTPGTFDVTARDVHGNTVTSYTGTVSFTSSDTAAVLPGAYTFVAGDNGVKTGFAATLKTSGSRTLVATGSTKTGTQTVTVNAAALDHFNITAYATPRTAGAAGTFTTTAKDAYDNTVTSFTGAVTFSSSDTAAVLPGAYTFLAGDNGVKAGLAATLKTTGSQSLTATGGGKTGTLSVTVNPAAASYIVVSGYPSPQTKGVSGTFGIVLKDVYGNTATTFTGAVGFTSSDGSATLPSSYTFVSGDAGVKTGLSATFRTLGSQTLVATVTATPAVTGSQTIVCSRIVATVDVLTALASNGKVVLSWNNDPADHDGVLIVRSTSAPVAATPVNAVAYQVGDPLGNGVVVYVDSASTVSSFTDTTVVNGLTYYYKVFNKDGSLLYSSGNVPTTAGIFAKPNAPSSTTPTWCYSLGLPTTQQPFVEAGVAVYTSSNARSVTANVISTNALLDSKERWRPTQVSGVIQSRATIIGLYGRTGTYLITADQAGRAYLMSSSTGALVWTGNGGAALGDAVQAQAIPQLYSTSNTAFRAAYPAKDLIYYPTRNSSRTNNEVWALSSVNGAMVWKYSPGDLDFVSGGMLIDYTTNRLWLASRAGATGTQASLRVLNVLSPTTPVASFTGLGDIDAPVVRNPTTNQAYVTALNGMSYGFNMTTMALAWSYNTGVVNNYLMPYGTGFIASTNTGVQYYNVNTTTNVVTPVWSSPPSMNNPSAVRLDTATGKGYVGDGNGTLHRINLATGVDEAQINLSALPLGMPTIDTATTQPRAYVGSLDGRLCAVNLPF